MKYLTEPFLMDGTEGPKSYLLVARRGLIGFGIKPNVIADGKVPNTTCIGLRIRSAKLPNMELFHDEVAVLGNAGLTVESAWPKVKWSKADASRASTQIGMLAQGKVSLDPGSVLEFITGKFLDDLGAYLNALIPPDDMVLSEAQIRAWFAEFYGNVVKEITAKVTTDTKIQKNIEASVGSFYQQEEITTGSLVTEASASKSLLGKAAAKAAMADASVINKITSIPKGPYSKKPSNVDQNADDVPDFDENDVHDDLNDTDDNGED